jgi:predicted RNase H-like HicB family nuclease
MAMAAQTDDKAEGYEFHIVMHPAEEGGYWAEVIELPGCMSQGETEEELAANLADAIRAVLASYASDGEPPPLPRPVKTAILRVPIIA